MTTVLGIEAIKLYMPPTKEQISANIKEEKDQTTANTATTQSANAAQPKLLTSVERYRKEWEVLLTLSQKNAESIRELAFRGSLKVSKFRSIYWAILLRVLNPTPSDWLEQRQQQRLRYDKLKTEFIKNPHETNGDNDDPLSQSTKSVWNQYFNDQELFAIIKQDVVRTFPGVDFFRKQHIQNAMCNILFYYAREHPYMNYRQGMHEILAPLLFVMYGDQQSLLHFLEVEKQQINTLPLSKTLQSVLHADYLEADTYCLFGRLMSLIESYYRVPNQESLDDALDNESISKTTSEELEVIGQLNFIRDKILAKADLHLHNYLIKLEIPLHIFGIRWLRLLFGREFPLLDLLMLWDAIFADSDRFELPNYILVAMLIRIRNKLILSDFTTCMTFLMRYPTNIDVNVILQHALHMHIPKRFDMPPNAFVSSMNTATTTSNHVTNKTHINTFAEHDDWTRVDLISYRPSSQPHKYNGAVQRARSTSFDAVNANRSRPQKQYLTRAARAEDTELLQLELRNADTIIKIARHKIQTYMTTMRHHMEPLLQKNVFPEKAAQELRQTFDGMEQLCSFLDLKYLPTPIDLATEADEVQERQKQEKAAQQETIENDVVDGATLQQTLYERPDNSLKSSGKLLLSDVKEFEMLHISKAENALDVTLDGASHVSNSTTHYFPALNPLTPK